jgi:hypothetical protein
VAGEIPPIGVNMTQVVDIVYIFDRSGSMANLMSDAIGGFNSFVKEQQIVDGEAYLTLVAFDDRVEIIHDRVDVKNVPELTIDKIAPRGMTALRDAIGQSISKMPETFNVICLIQTDGFENASTEWTSKAIKELIASREAAGWKFEYVGIGKSFDVYAQGGDLGLSKSSINIGEATPIGYAQMNQSFAIAATAYRSSVNNDPDYDQRLTARGNL